jgi:hypothetical protein
MKTENCLKVTIDFVDTSEKLDTGIGFMVGPISGKTSSDIKQMILDYVNSNNFYANLYLLIKDKEIK